MRTMQRIFDKSDISYRHTNNRSFQYDTFAFVLGSKCSESVRKKLGGLIALNKEEIEVLIEAMPHLPTKVIEAEDEFIDVFDDSRPLNDDQRWYKAHEDALDDCLSEACDHKVGCIKFTEKDIKFIISRLDRVATEPSEIKLINTFIEWYGFKREALKFHKDYIPQDIGRGIYDGAEYCGTTAREFISGTPMIEEIAA